ncbi:FMN-binding protein [Clostridium sp. 'White wine YQ']|uniref:FMN-binding protein n=1 Tax=Clostridium sp. 'White wine YQ' TaxID=3027474 RepID=UPI002365FB86|nr:FMN-binding protein [Clostridium sp. 'White wine YQ']MDD7793906.1 FMN-binding protein [Clostridium sp. 'White wine YQ']
MSKRKIIVSIIGIAAIIAIYFGVKGIKSYMDLKTYQKQVNDIVISEVDLTKVPDGTYEGSTETLWVAAEVKVTVKDHKITKIDLVKHKYDRGKPAEVLVDKVVEDQKVKVDTVSGATVSSKVILKSIEKALESAGK